jgi:lipoprotein signal peptidase
VHAAKRRGRGSRITLGVVGLAIADLASKQLVHSTAGKASGVNHSTMFGVVTLSKSALLICSLLAALAATSVAVWLWRQRRLGGVALALLIAGFLGNLGERLASGHVRDWIPVGATRWNLADVYLIIAIPWVLAMTISSVYLNDQGREVTI